MSYLTTGDLRFNDATGRWEPIGGVPTVAAPDAPRCGEPGGGDITCQRPAGHEGGHWHPSMGAPGVEHHEHRGGQHLLLTADVVVTEHVVVTEDQIDGPPL